METKIIKSTKNPLLNREEIVLEIKSSKNPNFEEVKEKIGKDKDLTIVKKIKGNFGKHSFLIEAVVYHSKESKDKVEKISRKARKKMQEEVKKAAQPVA